MRVLGEHERLTAAAAAPRSTFIRSTAHFPCELFVLAAPTRVKAQTEIGPEGGTVAGASEFASSTTRVSFERHRELRDAREQSAANLFARNRSSAVGRSTDMPYTGTLSAASIMP